LPTEDEAMMKSKEKKRKEGWRSDSQVSDAAAFEKQNLAAILKGRKELLS